PADSFNDSVALPVHTLSLHDALPICFFDDKKLEKIKAFVRNGGKLIAMQGAIKGLIGKNRFGIKEKKIETDRLNIRLPYAATERDRKSTRLNSSHVKISYADICLKKK